MGKTFLASDNPFTLQFSYIPPRYITRKALTEEIVNDLDKKLPAFRCHFLTGVRGTGKSVLMADIAKSIVDGSEHGILKLKLPRFAEYALLQR